MQVASTKLVLTRQHPASGEIREDGGKGSEGGFRFGKGGTIVGTDLRTSGVDTFHNILSCSFTAMSIQ